MYTIDRGYDDVTGKHRGIIYHIDEEKRTVVARLIECKEDLINQIENATRYFPEFDLSYTIFHKNYKDYKIPDEFIGIAKCDPRDIFDVEKGKEIAKARCLMKYHDAKYRAAARAVKRVEEISNILNDILDRQADIVDDKFNDLMEVNPPISK